MQGTPSVIDPDVARAGRYIRRSEQRVATDRAAQDKGHRRLCWGGFMSGMASEQMQVAGRIDPVSIGNRLVLPLGEQGYPAGAGRQMTTKIDEA